MKEQSLETITLQEALDLFKLPRKLGDYEGQEMIVAAGKFGPYIRHAGVFYSLPKTDDPLTISKERAIDVIEAKRIEEKNTTTEFRKVRMLQHSQKSNVVKS